jgi:hypothetical protein
MGSIRFSERAHLPLEKDFARWPGVYVHPGEFKSVLDRPRPDDLETCERYLDRFRRLSIRVEGGTQRLREKHNNRAHGKHPTTGLLASIGATAVDPHFEGTHTFRQHVKYYIVVEHLPQKPLEPVGAQNGSREEDRQLSVCGRKRQTVPTWLVVRLSRLLARR